MGMGLITLGAQLAKYALTVAHEGCRLLCRYHGFPAFAHGGEPVHAHVSENCANACHLLYLIDARQFPRGCMGWVFEQEALSLSNLSLANFIEYSMCAMALIFSSSNAAAHSGP